MSLEGSADAHLRFQHHLNKRRFQYIAPKFCHSGHPASLLSSRGWLPLTALVCLKMLKLFRFYSTIINFSVKFLYKIINWAFQMRVIILITLGCVSLSKALDCVNCGVFLSVASPECRGKPSNTSCAPENIGCLATTGQNMVFSNWRENITML